MEAPAVEIRNLTLEELKEAISWAAIEGWNPGIEDASAFYAADPGGFFGAFEGGKLLGAISAVLYGREFSFVGLFIVRPELRGGSLGPLLGKAALARLQGVNAGVDGVERKVKNYEGYGFKFAHSNIRFECISGFVPKAKRERARPLSSIPFSKLLDYDSRHFPARREAFLMAWTSAPGHSGHAILDRFGEIEGYAVMRPCVKGFKIGPLFASGREVAESLLSSLLQSLPEDTLFYLDVPATNEDAIAMASDWGMKQVFRTARMYNLFRPELPEREIFGISSFELG